MAYYSSNGLETQVAEYESPFAEAVFTKEMESGPDSPIHETTSFEIDSPFSKTYETNSVSEQSPRGGEFVQFIAELQDHEFNNALYELATELEDSWSSKISSEVAMGDRFIPFARNQANTYFAPLVRETQSMIDRVSEHFSGNGFGSYSETEVDNFFSELEFDHSQFSPAQEQFFGSFLNKVKSVVKKGIDLAKKGISVVGKILPINMILSKLKSLIKPLLEKVLKFAIGKLPKVLQPYAQALAKKFLNLESSEGETSAYAGEIPSAGELESIQTELDNHLANLVFSNNEAEAEDLVANYEMSNESIEHEMNYETGGHHLHHHHHSLHAARHRFICDLKDLKEGESPAPAIERFLPAVMLALQPIIKIATSLIGRPKIINFLGSLLAKLVGKYVPENVALPLSSSIVDVGLSAIGFETYEAGRPDLGYESIANTIQETIQNLGEMNETVLNDHEELTNQVLEAFETAAANNFPSQYIKPELHPASQPGLWVLKPRSGSSHFYKKYTKVFPVTIDPQMANSLITFRGLPLTNFLKDKLGLDPTKPIQARVHLYEAIEGTWLSRINKYEKVPGLGVRHGWIQFHPLSKNAATLLLKEPGLGKDFSEKFTGKRHKIAVGQRFYYLEISGARLRTSHVHHGHKHTGGVSAGQLEPSHSADIQAVINFVKSEIRFNYFFSEEEAKNIVEKLNKNDFLGAARGIRNSVKNVLHEVLVRHIESKVKIINETTPELFLENYAEQEGGAGGFALRAGKEILTKLITKIIDTFSEQSYQAVVDYFKSRAAEFKQALTDPADGVTIKIIWNKIPGMSAIRTVVDAIKGKGTLGNLSNLAIPSIPAPEIQVVAGKHFD
jgi:hypothetical protein